VPTESVAVRGSSFAFVLHESKENVMNSRVRIVKRNEIHEPKKVGPGGKPTELRRDREMVTVVKSWIDEFKLRSRQNTQITLPLPHEA